MTDRVLVTGGAGFIGSHLLKQLVAKGAHVTVVDKLATAQLSYLPHVMGQIECSVSPEIRHSVSIRPGDAERWVVDISVLASLGCRAEMSLTGGLQAPQDWFERELH